MRKEFIVFGAGNGVVAVVAVVVYRLIAKKLLHLKNLGVVAVVVALLVAISYMKAEHCR